MAAVGYFIFALRSSQIGGLVADSDCDDDVDEVGQWLVRWSPVR